MKKQATLYNPAAIGFTTIFEGREAMVTISSNDGRYDIYINGTMVGQIKFDENSYRWYMANGDLSDPDLVEEIGERIEMTYN
jgi:hypothetical protein